MNIHFASLRNLSILPAILGILLALGCNDTPTPAPVTGGGGGGSPPGPPDDGNAWQVPAGFFGQPSQVVADADSIWIAGAVYTPHTFNDVASIRVERRRSANGALMTEFGTDGALNWVDDAAREHGVILQSGAEGLFVGTTRLDAGGKRRCCVERRDSVSGALLDGFGAGGTLLWSPDGADASEIRSIALQDGWMHVLLEYFGDSATDLRMHRYERRAAVTGELVDGYDTIVPALAFESLRMSLAPAAVYFTLTTMSAPGDWNTQIVKRRLPDLHITPEFGTDGWIVWDPTTGRDAAEVVADGQDLYVFGESDDSIFRTQVIERRKESSGELVPGFGTGGRLAEMPYPWASRTVTRRPLLAADRLHVLRSSTGFDRLSAWSSVSTYVVDRYTGAYLDAPGLSDTRYFPAVVDARGFAMNATRLFVGSMQGEGLDDRQWVVDSLPK